MTTPGQYRFDLPEKGRPEVAFIPERWYPDINKYWNFCSSRRSVHPVNGIKAIVIHTSDGANSAESISMMKDGKRSFHWLVPGEKEPGHGSLVWACVPETLSAWHTKNTISHPNINSGKNFVNQWSLSVQIVNSQPISAWQIAITAEIVRCSWAKFPNLRHVVSHSALEQIGDDEGNNFYWEEFKAKVLTTSEIFSADKLLSKISPIMKTRTIRGKNLSLD